MTVSSENAPVCDYLQGRLVAARRRARWRGVVGLVAAAMMMLFGHLAVDAIRDPEGVVELLPLHTGRYVQGAAVRSLQAGAPNTARAARRQIDRVPSEINAVVRNELSRWASRSVDNLVDEMTEQLGVLAYEQPEAIAAALDLASDGANATAKAKAASLHTLIQTELRPRMIERVEPLEVGPVAYLVATANAIERLDEDTPSAERELERIVLALLAQLIAPN